MEAGITEGIGRNHRIVVLILQQLRCSFLIIIRTGNRIKMVRDHYAMHFFDKAQYSKLLREARYAACQKAGAEICGLIINTGYHLAFVQTRNASRRAGGFVLSSPDVRRIVAATQSLGQEVVGTFHSHPAALPAPGDSDIRHAVDDSLMFIFDCIGRKGRLWKIKKGRARSIKFRFLARSHDA